MARSPRPIRIPPDAAPVRCATVYVQTHAAPDIPTVDGGWTVTGFWYIVGYATAGAPPVAYAGPFTSHVDAGKALDSVPVQHGPESSDRIPLPTNPPPGPHLYRLPPLAMGNCLPSGLRVRDVNPSPRAWNDPLVRDVLTTAMHEMAAQMPRGERDAYMRATLDYIAETFRAEGYDPPEFIALAREQYARDKTDFIVATIVGRLEAGLTKRERTRRLRAFVRDAEAECRAQGAAVPRWLHAIRERHLSA